MLALNYALRGNVKTLFISADTSKGDTVLRVSSFLTGRYRVPVEHELNQGPEKSKDLYDRLRDVDNIDFFFRTGIDDNDIRMMLFSYAERHGRWPELVVVDNLVNLIVDQSAPGEWQMTMRNLDEMAKETESCFMVLSHVAGHKENGDQPIGLSDVLYKVTKDAALVLTLTHDSFDKSKLLVSCVKNRNGRADKSGNIRYPLSVVPELSRITDPLWRTVI